MAVSTSCLADPKPVPELQQKIAQLEAENKAKDEQIALLTVAIATLRAQREGAEDAEVTRQVEAVRRARSTPHN